MPDIDTDWQGRPMVDRDGDNIGRVEAIDLDDDTAQPEWALVYTGLFGTKATFVPLAQAQTMGDSVQVPYQKQLVKDAPGMEADGQLSQDEEAELYRHYGLDLHRIPLRLRQRPARRTADRPVRPRSRRRL